MIQEITQDISKSILNRLIMQNELKEAYDFKNMLRAILATGMNGYTDINGWIKNDSTAIIDCLSELDEEMVISIYIALSIDMGLERGVLYKYVNRGIWFVKGLMAYNRFYKSVN